MSSIYPIEAKQLTRDLKPTGVATTLYADIRYELFSETAWSFWELRDSSGAVLRKGNTDIPITGWKQDDTRLLKNLCDILEISLITE